MPVSRVRQVFVWSSATVLSLVALLVGFAVWAVGLGRYLEDYCFTKVSPPTEDGIRGPFLEWPWTVRCDYDRTPDAAVADPWPLAWTLGVVASVLVGVVVVLWVARLLTRRPAAS